MVARVAPRQRRHVTPLVRSVSGWLRQESAWRRIEQWIRAAHVRAALRHARHGLMGHLYPGMLDVSTDLTLLPTTFGRTRSWILCGGRRRPARHDR